MSTDVCLTISDDPGQDVWLEIREALGRPTCYKTIERYRGHAQYIKCAVRHRQKGPPTQHMYTCFLMTPSLVTVIPYLAQCYTFVKRLCHVMTGCLQT